MCSLKPRLLGMDLRRGLEGAERGGRQGGTELFLLIPGSMSHRDHGPRPFSGSGKRWWLRRSLEPGGGGGGRRRNGPGVQAGVWRQAHYFAVL